jgi:hypothetical protein
MGQGIIIGLIIFGGIMMLIEYRNTTPPKK